MNVHKITLYVVDFDQLGGREVQQTLENANYPNDCINPCILSVQSRDIGEWDDSHPLNNSKLAPAEIERLFAPSSVQAVDGDEPVAWDGKCALCNCGSPKVCEFDKLCHADLFWSNRPPAAKQALNDLMAERHRQMMKEGWTAKHDDDHNGGAMAIAAASYALAGHPTLTEEGSRIWGFTGWAWGWWKPKDPRRNLVRAGALILAEIERLDRAAMKDNGSEPMRPYFRDKGSEQ